MESILHFGLSNALLATALALPAALVSRFCQRPALAHSLWLLVLLKLFTPPLWSVPILWLSPSTQPTLSTALSPVRGAEREGTDQAGPQSLTLADAVGQEDFPVAAVSAGSSLLPDVTAPEAAVWPEPAWALAAGLGWGVGTAVWLASVSWRLCRFQRLLRGARQAPLEVRNRTRCLAGGFRLTRCPDVWFVPGRVSPMLWTWAGPPRLLLPEGLWHRLSRGQQDTLLAHELAHLRRRDHWVRWLELAALALYWWHPLVWWAQRELEESEEQCCDAWVVAVLPAAAEVYAEALLQTVAYLSQARAPVAVGASGAGRLHHVRRRLIMILDGTAPKALSPAGRWAVLVLAAVLLPLWPTWAHSQVSPSSDTVRPNSPDPFRNATQTGVRAGSTSADVLSNTTQTGVVANSASADVATSATEEDGRANQIDQARAAVRDLTSELALIQDQMAKLTARLQEARARLARLEGHREPLSGNGVPEGRNFGRTPAALPGPVPRSGSQLAIPVPATMQPRPTPAPVATSVLAGPPGGPALSVSPASTPRNRQQGQPGAGMDRAPRRGEGDYEQRLSEVEAKLDTLLKELKTLRDRQQTAPGALQRR